MPCEACTKNSRKSHRSLIFKSIFVERLDLHCIKGPIGQLCPNSPAPARNVGDFWYIAGKAFPALDIALPESYIR
jgi:hypothetical protein